MSEKNRFYLLSAVIFLSFGLIMLRLFKTTLTPDPRLKDTIATKVNPRGTIYDRNGHIIAGISSTKSLYVRPKNLEPEVRSYISNYLVSTGYFSNEELLALDDTNRNFVYLKRDMTPSIYKPVIVLYKALKQEGYLAQDGLNITTEESRFYPYSFLTPIIGMVGREGYGLYGVEYSLNTALENGNNAVLTIDTEISRAAYEELVQVVTEAGADSGSVVIMDIKNREILASVQYGESASRATSVSHIYEPGSVMKIFSAAFAMEQGLASTTSPNFNDSTPYKVGDYTFKKPAYGYIPLKTMLKKSSNIAFARLAGQFGSDDFYLWLSELGFGKRQYLPLTSIEKGILHPTKKWSALSKPMIAIGQEIGVTTLQLAAAASMIAGNGIYMPAELLRSLKTPVGKELVNDEREQIQMMHPLKSRELLYALEHVVSEGGTGHKASLEGVRIAGKTGTGMIADARGYSTARNNTVFIGFFPIEEPTITMVVAIHNPRKGSARSGGGVSAPLFANITRRILLTSGYSTF